MRHPLRQHIVGTLIWLALPGWTAAAVPLRDALQQLQDAGYPVVFSTDLVTPEMTFDGDVVTVDTVASALAAYGLVLDDHGDIWPVTRAAPEPSVNLRLQSSAGAAIRTPAISFGAGTRLLTPSGEHAFAVPARPGARARITAPGHHPAEVELTGDDQTVVLDAIRGVETVIVTGSRHVLPPRAATASSTRMTAAEMRVIPALGGDSLRVANRLPGMSSVGVSAKPRVRGGLQNETLILMDGIELIEAFHLADFQSVFSSIDDRTVDAIDVYTGGFPARYGNRMSGVMDVSTLDPPARRGSEVGLSMYTAFANTRGHTEDGDTDWLASVRHGNLELLIDRLNSRQGTPKYLDAYARVGRALGEHAKLYVGGFLSGDDVELNDGDETAKSDIDSRYVWMRLDTTLGPHLDNSTGLSYVTSKRKKQQLSPPEDEDIRGFLDHHQNTDRFTLKTDFALDWRDTRVELGGQLEHAETHYDTTALVDRGDIAVVLGRAPLEAIDIHVAPTGWAGGLYVSGDVPLTDRLRIQPGVRWDFQDYYTNGDFEDHFSPRLGTRFEWTDELLVRLDVGRFYQPEPTYALQTTDGVSTLHRPQRADHVVGGLYWDPSEDWHLRLEGYWKRYRRTALRFENIFNPFVILPELEPDRVPIAPQEAEVWGVDLEARHELGANLTGVLRYSYMDADDRLNGVWVPRRWSQRHTVNGILAWDHDAWSFAAAVTWHTGWRTSQPPASVQVGETLPIEDVLDNTELREFFSVDLSASRTWTVGRSTVTVFADLTNALDRNNVAGVDYDVEEVGDDFVFEPDSETLFPLIPSIGIVVSF